jgi:hypothetical protein
MSYATSNPPAKIAEFIGGSGSVWLYRSADVDSAVNAADYFSNGDALGMVAGDVVMVIDTTTPKASFHYVASVTSGGAATTAFGVVA